MVTNPFASAALPVRAPSLLRLLGEVESPLHAIRLLTARDRLADAPAVNVGGSTVVVIPGYYTPEWMMTPLRRFLAAKGHEAMSWGLGHNTSDVVAKVRALVPRVRELAVQHDRPVRLVGWSLGGLVAREVARDAPSAVDRIVTIGAPVIGGPRWTNARFGYSPAAIERFRQAADARSRFPIRRPITSIVSRRDGVIAWRAQVDHHSEDVRHIEVSSTHTAMALDPDVWVHTAQALSA